MGLLLIAALLALGYLLYKDSGRLPSTARAENRMAPIDIINERYARGDIDRDEYKRLTKELR